MASVLVVSNDVHTAELAALICRSAGHSIAIVDNGLQAIMVLDERQVDVIVADLVPARFCAHALARLVRSAAMPDGRAAIVAMAERGERVGDLAIAAAILKPLRPDVLRHALASALGHAGRVEIQAPNAAALELE